MSDTPEMLAVRPLKRRIDPLEVVLGALVLIGLICINLTGWIVYTRQYRRTLEAQSVEQRAALRSALSAVSAGATAEVVAAQTRQAELAGELELARDELARLSAHAASSDPALAAPTHLDRPPLALILDVPLFKQTRNLSCESSAASMAAHFYGAPVSEADIFAALPRDENPHRGFRGNVDGVHGGLDDYGVYAGPIARVLTDLGLPVQSFSGGASEIRAHLRREQLIIAWVTYDLQVQIPREVMLGSGEVVTLLPFEHVLLVTGYNADGFWVNDPYSGTARFYVEDEFMRSFAYLGNMALVIGP